MMGAWEPGRIFFRRGRPSPALLLLLLLFFLFFYNTTKRRDAAETASFEPDLLQGFTLFMLIEMALPGGIYSASRRAICISTGMAE